MSWSNLLNDMFVVKTYTASEFLETMKIKGSPFESSASSGKKTLAEWKSEYLEWLERN